MAELASGAVTSLLGVIRNEWRLLGRVGGDVQFIHEEMDSMNSFLMHLARTTPPGSEHDEQVRTWMNQVRVLAQDCNNCIDLYLYRGNPDIHLGSDRLRRYLRWVPWFLQKMWAQHRAALELGDLKERARDVGQRRLRYGVEVPKKAAAEEGSSEPAAFLHFDDDQEDGHETDASDRIIRRALFGLYVREDYFNDLLGEWIKEVRAQWSPPDSQGRHDTRCVAFVVPSTESGAIARQASAVAKKHVNNTILVDIPSLHIWSMLGPKNILYYILREIELQQQQEAQADAKSQQQGQVNYRWHIREEKRTAISKIKQEIKKLKVTEKIEEIKTHIEEARGDNEKLQPYLTKPRKKEDYITKDKINKDNHALGVLLVLLLRSSAAAAAADETEPALAEHYDDILKKTAEKLREHMGQVNTRAFTGQLLRATPTSTAAFTGRLPVNIGLGATDRATAGAAATGPQTIHSVGPQIIHSETQYAQILQEVFKKISSPSKTQQAQEQDNKQATTKATPGKDQIREIIDKVKQEILSEVLMAMGDKGQEATKTVSATTTLGEAHVKKMIQEAMQQLKEEKPADKKQETCVPGAQGPTTEAPTEEPNKEKGQPATATGSNPAQGEVDEITEKTRKILDAAIKETTEKMKYNVQWRIKRQLDINGIVAKIQNHLKHDEETLIILKVDEKYVSQWEQTRNALSLLPCTAVVMILTKTETNLKRAKQEYCYPKGEEPKDYSSLAALYHGILLKITSQQNNEENDHDAQILHTILGKCETNELCMKIFAHALYAKPKRSKEELHGLHNALQVLPQKSYRSIAMKMLKFSYWDMPKDYQSCLLYLAIFPRGHKIRRSTLIGRWVAEGMITTEDWRWSSSVQKAEQCFDVFVTRGLVYSAEISATGRVKSCMVGDLVHEFITEIAKKQRIVEARLSHHLARHFSIFNDLHLRGSDHIDAFLKSSSKSSQWSRLKVLDLEGCTCFMDNRRYLKNICNNIFLLKYLSLRGTDVNWLPREINNLRELEVLDIHQTDVPESSTSDLLLLKLKRLLAGNKNPSPNSSSKHVLVPEKIGKMLHMEVLSNVKAKSSQDFDGITKLWQLRKLGVVVKFSHLNKLLQAISDLHECLRTLSITVDTTGSIDSREPKHSPKDNKTEKKAIKDSPKVLERLSISGKIPENPLLQFLDVGNPLIKVTLSNTSMSQKILDALSQLSMLRCLKLRHNTYSHNNLTFKKGEFKKLKYFLVEGSNRIEVSFEEAAAKELEKIVLSFDSIQSITGVHHLQKLEELELNNDINSRSNSGGISKPPQPATSPPPPTTATTVTNDHVLSTTTATDPTSTPNTAAAVIPSPSAPAATSIANDPIPSAATTTDTTPSAPTTSNIVTTNPSPSAATATATANDPILSTTTNLTPYVPTAAAIPSDSAPSATDVANDPIPSTDTTSTAPTTSATTTIPSSSSATATAAANDPVLFTTTTTDTTPTAPTTAAIPSTSAPAATAVANDPIPSTATSTDTTPTAPTTSNIVTTIPSPPAVTATAAANDPVLSTATTTNPTPHVPATTAIPSTSTPVATAASDTIPSTATATTIPTPSNPTTSNNNNILFLKLLYDVKQIAKVTLRGTMLKQDDIRSLARVENIRCMVLLHESYGESQLNFNKDEFPKLNLLIVNCCTITNIKFDHGSAPKLEKIVWTFNQKTCLSGIENLPRLKELELTGESLPIQVKEGIGKHKDRIHCTHYKLESLDQTVRSTAKEDSVPRCLHIWKDKGCCKRRN